MKKNIVIISIFSLLIILFLLIFFKQNLFYSNSQSSNKLIINWVAYENKDHGFAFNYPSKSLDSSHWSSQFDDLSNLTSNKVLEGGNVFYIRPDGQDFKQVDSVYNQIQQDSNRTNKYGVAWRIVIKDIKDEQDLDYFIKEQYGNGCSYDKKHVTEYPDTFDVVIKGDGKPLDLTDCPVNYDYHIKYSPNHKKAAFWHTGQECQIGLSFFDCFDDGIIKSFRFISN